LSMGTATAETKTTEPVDHITWNEAGPEIERRGISLQRLRVSGAFMANCQDAGTGRYVEAFGRSALAAVRQLLKKIGGANGRKTDTAVGPDQERRA
jgi:hypothetical protein